MIGLFRTLGLEDDPAVTCLLYVFGAIFEIKKTLTASKMLQNTKCQENEK